MTVLWKYGVPANIGRLIEQMYTGTWCQVKVEGELSEKFEVSTGARQGCILSPILFNCYMDNILREAAESMNGGITIEYNTSSQKLFLTYQSKIEGEVTIYEILCMQMTWP